MDLGHRYIILFKNYFPKDPNSTEFAAQGILKVQSPLPVYPRLFYPRGCEDKVVKSIFVLTSRNGKGSTCSLPLPSADTSPGRRLAHCPEEPACGSSRVATGASLPLLLLPLCPYALPPFPAHQMSASSLKSTFFTVDPLSHTVPPGRPSNS